MEPLFPSIDDPALDSLRIASDRAAMSDLFRENLPQARYLPGGPTAASARVVKYRPGRRCTILYEIADYGKHVYAKIYYNERGRSIYGKMRTVREACGEAPLTPEAYAYLPDHRMLLIEGIQGTPLSQVGGDQLNDLAKRTAEALARLHGVKAEIDNSWRLPDEMSVLWNRVKNMAINVAAIGPTVLDLSIRLQRGQPQTDATPCPIHRDLYPAQVIVAGANVRFVDLDDMAAGDPAIDAGNFAAHVSLLSFHRYSDTSVLKGVRRAFLDSYTSAAPNVLPASIAFFEASSLLRLASLASERPDGAREMEAMLAQSEEVLSSMR